MSRIPPLTVKNLPPRGEYGSIDLKQIPSIHRHDLVDGAVTYDPRRARSFLDDLEVLRVDPRKHFLTPPGHLQPYRICRVGKQERDGRLMIEIQGKIIQQVGHNLIVPYSYEHLQTTTIVDKVVYVIRPSSIFYNEWIMVKESGEAFKVQGVPIDVGARIWTYHEIVIEENAKVGPEKQCVFGFDVHGWKDWNERNRVYTLIEDMGKEEDVFTWDPMDENDRLASDLLPAGLLE